MKILLIDTCGAGGTLALGDSARTPPPAVFAQRTLAERSAAAMLVPAVRDLLESEKITLAELDAIAVVTGPGSFTGVRIGVSAAKGLSEGAGKPVIAISRLAVLASLCAAERVHAVLDAGRGEFYMGCFKGVECAHEAMVTRAELLAAVAAQPGVVCVCEAKLVEALPELTTALVAEPVAADGWALAAAAFAAKDFADGAALDGNYLRRADVEMLERQKAAAAAKRA